jgi:hypothetical protein
MSQSQAALVNHLEHIVAVNAVLGAKYQPSGVGRPLGELLLPAEEQPHSTAVNDLNLKPYVFCELLD